MLPNKSDCRKVNQSKKSKSFCNEFKGKKSGKAYFDYVEECKRKQELLIKQKLEEVKNGVKSEPNTSNVNYTNGINKTQENEELMYKKEKRELPFKSDGSFLEQFLKMQDSSVNVLVKQEKHLKHYEQTTNVIEGETMLGKVESKLPSKRSNKCLEDENEEIITPEDPKVLIAIENLVNQASLLPQNLQVAYIKQFEDQEEYWFLTLADSIEYSYFHWRLEQAKLEYLKKIEETNNNIQSNLLNSNSSTTVKKRKSRWSTELPKVLLIPVVSPNSQILTDSQKQQMEYQKELQAMHEFITAQQKAKEQELMNSIAGVTYGPAKTKLGQFKFEYDSDEDTKEGTWEHKLRKEEMEATRDWADKLTEMGQGKHHIGDFLPPEELDRFMETFRALKEGREPDYSDYTTFKITCENVGFKMLKKMGWKEGDGLGSDGQGIKVPLCNGPIKADNVGIGVTKMSKLTKFDDEYDAYRKRMMLAYRFRPNPLNNPRRDYY